MKSRKMTMLSTALAALLTLAAPSGFAADKTRELNDIAKAADTAKTPEDHARVAQQYNQRAHTLDMKAQKLEKELRTQDAGPTAAMAHKWPALMNNSRDRQERLAMQWRRAAEEARELARHHNRLAGRTADEVAVRK
jgi:hypothetical protein